LIHRTACEPVAEPLVPASPTGLTYPSMAAVRISWFVLFG